MSYLKILTGHNSKVTAYVVTDHPYGRKKAIKRYWIDTSPKFGDRIATQMINPITHKANAVKYGAYSHFAWLYLDEHGHVKRGRINFQDYPKAKSDLQFIVLEIGVANLSKVQNANIWVDYYSAFSDWVPEGRKKYSPEMQPLFDQWAEGYEMHIATSELADILKYRGRPAYIKNPSLPPGRD